MIIPTYNENQNIERLIDEVLSLSLDFDLLVIDDNSPDGTGKIVKDLAQKNNLINLISRPSKMGLGIAYMTGFRWALEKGYEFIVTMDADLSHKPKYLREIVELLDSNDLAIGSRYIPGGYIDGWPFVRKMISKFGNAYAKTVTGLNIGDMTSGFMGIKKALVSEIVNGNINSEGYSFLIEVKGLAFKKGCKIKEFPIVFFDRIAGKSKISRKIILEALFKCWKLRFSNLHITK